MNFPVGANVVEGNLPNKFLEMAELLHEKKFNGYVIQSAKGDFIEDGIVFFRDGEVSACIVECISVKKIYKGNEALDFFLNQTKGKGFFQVIELTRSQVDLVEAFDEKLILNKINLKDLPKLIPNTYAIRFKNEVVLDNNVFERYGLSGLNR